ncbi:MAG: cytochrome c biogenesis protein CcsA [Calditrichaeota bacterium]|nr:cytochrome c biogenesis protein CcsA [Calditrichota bacterium]
MIIGFMSITVAFVASVVAIVAYYFYHRDRTPEMLQLANRSFYLMSAGIIFASGLLMYYIMTHRFDVNYVYSYSSRSLSWDYLMSTFWAGQEGTFLLWLFYGVIYGIILIRRVGKDQPLVLVFFTLVQAYILLILLKKNPFAMVWHVHEEAPVGFVPRDGAGLNPLLINPWMRVHPPTLFLGYSSAMVLFAFAMAAMINKDFHGWIKHVRPWAVFVAMSLGAGIILGGYWAYITLGWGGYWAWDPVENASLVPWLLSAVLVHGIIIQSRIKGLVKTNLFVAGLTFITVLWGSFLTRSGVLTDFSVHSFAESGLNIYLILMVLLFTALFLFVFFRETRGVESPRFTDAFLTRETLIFVGMMTLFVTSILVLVATSSPIYTGLFGNPASVSAEYYNQVIIPIAVFMIVALALAPMLGWKVARIRDWATIIKAAIVAMVTTLVGIVLGLRDWISITLLLLSMFAFVTNGVFIYRFMRKNFMKSGAYLAHVGLALMVIGIVISSIYDRSERVSLPKGEFQKTSLGIELKFEGFVPQPDGRDMVKLIVRTPEGEEYEAYPLFYYSDYNQSYMASPDVKSSLTKDIYIEPFSFTPGELLSEREITLDQNESEEIGDLRVEFTRFDVAMGSDKQVVKAKLKVARKENNYWKEYEISPAIYMQPGGGMKREEVALPGTDYRFYLKSVDATSKRIQLAIKMGNDEEQKDTMAVEVREKPMMAVLWLGTILLIGGILMVLVDQVKSRRRAR